MRDARVGIVRWVCAAGEDLTREVAESDARERVTVGAKRRAPIEAVRADESMFDLSTVETD
jgi:hypothetical protein